jgi:hypothetical protein
MLETTFLFHNYLTSLTWQSQSTLGLILVKNKIKRLVGIDRSALWDSYGIKMWFLALLFNFKDQLEPRKDVFVELDTTVWLRRCLVFLFFLISFVYSLKKERQGKETNTWILIAQIVGLNVQNSPLYAPLGCENNDEVE